MILGEPPQALLSGSDPLSAFFQSITDTTRDLLETVTGAKRQRQELEAQTQIAASRAQAQVASSALWAKAVPLMVAAGALGLAALIFVRARKRDKAKKAAGATAS